MELKTKNQINLIRRAGVIAAEALEDVKGLIKEGVSTAEIDRRVEELILKKEAIPVFKGYRIHDKTPYPNATCISVNQQVMHGIPREDRFLKAGDLVKLDVGVQKEGWCADTAITFIVPGKKDQGVIDLVEQTKSGLVSLIVSMRIRRIWGALYKRFEDEMGQRSYKVLKPYIGHGIGTHLHEFPILGQGADNLELYSGMVLAVEPMLSREEIELVEEEDNWGLVDKKGGWVTHFEHTVAITKDGPLILTSL